MTLFPLLGYYIIINMHNIIITMIHHHTQSCPIFFLVFQHLHEKSRRIWEIQSYHHKIYTIDWEIFGSKKFHGIVFLMRQTSHQNLSKSLWVKSSTLESLLKRWPIHDKSHSSVFMALFPWLSPPPPHVFSCINEKLEKPGTRLQHTCILL